MSILIPKGANDAINSREEFFKEKEDHIKKQKREKFISDKLEAAGMRYNYSKKRFESKDKSVILTFEDFQGCTDEQIDTMIALYKLHFKGDL